jgi:ABC-type glycerol-3-phosphate transport system substrate-binding protein
VVVFFAVMSMGAACQATQQQLVSDASRSITLEVWGVWDNPDELQPVLNQFQGKYNQVSINYRKFRYEEYERALLEAMAEGTGPDIYAVHNTWMQKYKSRLQPSPQSLKMSQVQRTQGALGRQETTVTILNLPGTLPADVRARYATVVAGDAVMDNLAYGLPLSMDSLVLYYNQQLMDAAGIPNAPKTWDELKAMVPRLTLQNAQGEIVQSAIPLGTATNVSRSTDILANLMYQTGTQMLSEGGAVLFNQPLAGQNSAFVPGEDAMRFYTDFASPSSSVYTWNSSLPDGFQAFVSGQAAMFIGYAYHLPLIRTQAPTMDVRVTGFPQITESPVGGGVYFANYWLYGVAKSTNEVDAAWALVQHLGSAEAAQLYATTAGRPTALRALIDAQSADERIGVFAKQVLGSRSWYRGLNSTAAEAALKDAINEVNTGTRVTQEALNIAAQRVAQTLR